MNAERVLVASMRWTAGIHGLLALAGVVGTVYFFGRGNLSLGTIDAVAVVLFGVLAARAARGGVFTDDVDVMGRSEAGRSRVAWAEVERFEYRGARGLGAWRRDGAWVPLLHLAPFLAEPAVNTLEAELTRHR